MKRCSRSAAAVVVPSERTVGTRFFCFFLHCDANTTNGPNQGQAKNTVAVDEEVVGQGDGLGGRQLGVERDVEPDDVNRAQHCTTLHNIRLQAPISIR